MRWGTAVSLVGQTGQSEDIHSPDVWRRVVVSLIKLVSGSIAVVCTVAISCLLRHLRTISRPLARDAYWKVRLCSRGKAEGIVAVNDFSGFLSSAWAFAKAPAILLRVPLEACTCFLQVYFAGFRAAYQSVSATISILIARTRPAASNWFSRWVSSSTRNWSARCDERNRRSRFQVSQNRSKAAR